MWGSGGSDMGGYVVREVWGGLVSEWLCCCVIKEGLSDLASAMMMLIYYMIECFDIDLFCCTIYVIY